MCWDVNFLDYRRHTLLPSYGKVLRLVHMAPVLLLISLSLRLTDGAHASSRIEAPLSRGRHTLKGWWNSHSIGRRPTTTLDDYEYILIGSGPGGTP